MIFVLMVCNILLLIPCYLFSNIIYPTWTTLSKVCLLILGVKIRIIGKIPKEGHYVVVGNHTTFVDIFIIAIIGDSRKGSVFINKRLLNIPFLGTWLKLLKPIPINPTTGCGVRKGIEKAIYFINNENINFFGFPEGTRTINGEISNFKPGMFDIAIKSNVDVIPFGSAGSFEFKPKNRGWIKPGKIIVYIGNPISTQGKNREELCLSIKNEVSFCVKKAEALL